MKNLFKYSLVLLFLFFAAGCSKNESIVASASSSLNEDQADIVAESLTRVVVGSTLSKINGESMKPTLSRNSIIIIEPAAFSDISVGDIVVFYNINERRVAHRVISITNNGLITKGDNNDSVDNAIVTESNYFGRVAIIIYYR